MVKLYKLFTAIKAFDKMFSQIKFRHEYSIRFIRKLIRKVSTPIVDRQKINPNAAPNRA